MIVLLALLAFGDPDTAARQHFDRAEKAYRTGNYDVAVTEYQAAYDAKPVPALLYNLAQAYRKRYTVAGNVTDLRRAIEVFRAYLRDDPQTPQRETVERILGELRQSLAEVEARGKPAAPPPAPEPPTGPGTLMVSANVSGAQVFLDEAAMGPVPVTTAVDPGVHQLRVERQGYAAWTARVEVHPQETLRQTALLVELEAGGSEEPAPVYKRWWFWTAIGGAVVAGTVTAIAVSSGGSSPHGPTIDLSH